MKIFMLTVALLSVIINLWMGSLLTTSVLSAGVFALTGISIVIAGYLFLLFISILAFFAMGVI